LARFYRFRSRFSILGQPPSHRRQSGDRTTRGALLRWIAALCVAVVVLALGAAAALAEQRPVQVIRVLDGDTVLVRGDVDQVTVRLLGIDAPEKGRKGRPGEPYAGVATRFAQKRLARAERIALEVAGDRMDEHGRTLGFLWLWFRGRTDPVNLSEELLKGGLAEAIRFFDYPHKARFLKLEQGAKRRRLGIWGRGSNP
jgi:endonuclease YncB( thermonuclease family)